MNTIVPYKIEEIAKRVEACYIPRYDMWQMDSETLTKFTELFLEEAYVFVRSNGGLTSDVDYEAMLEHFGVE